MRLFFLSLYYIRSETPYTSMHIKQFLSFTSFYSLKMRLLSSFENFDAKSFVRFANLSSETNIWKLLGPRIPNSYCVTTKNGEDNWSRSTIQLEAVGRRSNNDHAKSTSQRTKTTLATNRHSRVRTQVDSTTPLTESDNSSHQSGQSD